MDSISNDFSHLSVGDLLASSGLSTTPALERISVERDVFTDDDHKLLDAKIVNAFSAFRKHNEEPNFSHELLWTTGGSQCSHLTKQRNCLIGSPPL